MPPPKGLCATCEHPRSEHLGQWEACSFKSKKPCRCTAYVALETLVLAAVGTILLRERSVEDLPLFAKKETP